VSVNDQPRKTQSKMTKQERIAVVKQKISNVEPEYERLRVQLASLRDELECEKNSFDVGESVYLIVSSCDRGCCNNTYPCKILKRIDIKNYLIALDKIGTERDASYKELSRYNC